MDGEQRAQAIERPGGFERAKTFDRVVLPIRLDDGHVLVAAAQRLQIGKRTFGALYDAAQAGFRAVAINHGADRAAGREINTHDRGRAHVKRARRRRGASRGGRKAKGEEKRQAGKHHGPVF